MDEYELLELELRDFTDRPHVVACNSGTSALHLALESLQLSPGSSVAVPAYTMVAVPRAVVLAGHVPVFFEGVPPRGCSAAIIAHVYGRQEQADWPHIPFVIEDMAELHGCKPHPNTAAACWSFYRNKVVAGEEGGCVAFYDAAFANYTRKLRSLGFTEAHDYLHIPRGHNYRLANTLAHLIRNSLAEVDANLVSRQVVEAWYDRYCPSDWLQPRRDSVWVYDVRIPGQTKEEQRERVLSLNEAGIAARQGFKPLYWSAEFAKYAVHCPQAEAAAHEVLYLPVSPHQSEASCDRAMRLLKSYVSPRKDSASG